MLHLIFIYRDLVNQYKYQRPKPNLAELCQKDHEENKDLHLEGKKNEIENFKSLNSNNKNNDTNTLDTPVVDVASVAVVETVVYQLEEQQQVKNEIQPDAAATAVIIENLISNEIQLESEVNTTHPVST